MSENSAENFTNLVPTSIEDEMKKSYLDYAMSVIVSRAIPDARDGLKPVHRRILYSMHNSSCDWNKPYRKSARIVGEVMGKYHPHGDKAIYDSLVRMAQNFSLRLPLVDGQGNFGSMDGDAPASMRYTESRLDKAAHSILADIDKNTIDFMPNYDGSELEPCVLPAMFPNLLVNGAGGIAVGMATNIPSHNLGEVIDACCAFVDDHQITIDQLCEIVKGPDFPTGGKILGKGGVRSGLHSGRGSIIIRGSAEIVNFKENRQAIVISEVPYQVNKAKMVEKIAENVRDKRIEGISDLRDESDKSGVRVVVELKKDVNADVVLNQLYSYTPLQVSFGINMLALDKGRPKVMGLRDVIESFVEFREEVVTRRTKFLLGKSRNRAHVLIGLSVAVANIDEVIATIRGSKDPNEAKEKLLQTNWRADNVQALIDLVSDRSNEIKDGHCFLTEAQVKAILEMKLQRLTGLEQEKINGDLAALGEEIKKFLEILTSREKLLNIVKEEMLAVKEEFATPRKTTIEEAEFEHDIEELIPREDMVITVTSGGYIKRVPLDSYRAQRRGGKGRTGLNMKDEEFTTDVFVASTHMPVLFFSNFGKVYKIKAYKLPLASPTTKGRALVNIFPLAEGEKITNIMALPEDEEEWNNLNIMFATNFGSIRRNDLSDFHNIQSNGKIAIKLDEQESLISVKLCDDDQHVLIAAKNGKCIRFPVSAVRVFKSRTSTGVRGIKLAKDDQVVSMSIINSGDHENRDEFLKIPTLHRIAISKLADENEVQEFLKANEIDSGLTSEKIFSMAQKEEFLLTITENGFGKRSSTYEYRITNRGGQGVTGIVTSPRNGCVVDSFTVEQEDQVMLVTDKGKMIRCPIRDVRIAGRNTQGVTLFKVENERVVSAARIDDAAMEDDIVENSDEVNDN